ncbi:glutamine amidotransferase [Kocuria sp. WRN011]|uniref:DJ-1/PfpI family protein n=1 Tax=Kocuria sp. WRN011 TaxID=2029858 RepID=UPI000BAEAD40|nr:DJ-1/PfpI family protein [Kocuria sp. WRN011]PBB07293.1 glutamine amidotransferase [Kocuria sp. WRN011]
MTRTAHVLLIDQVADWEAGHLLAELNTGRFIGEPWKVISVTASDQPVSTMGGLKWLPDITINDLDPTKGDLLIMPDDVGWHPGQEEPFVSSAKQFLDADAPVAAIWGATEALARAGLLDKRHHTAAAKVALEATGYKGSDRYLDQRAVAADGLLTAGPQSPVQFARATLGMLGLISDEMLEAYEALFHRGDPSAFPVLMSI